MYSPKIKEEFVRMLYQLKQIEKRPITHLANEAIEKYLGEKFRLQKEVAFENVAESINLDDSCEKLLLISPNSLQQNHLFNSMKRTGSELVKVNAGCKP